jgi:hypothetical protein
MVSAIEYLPTVQEEVYSSPTGQDSGTAGLVRYSQHKEPKETKKRKPEECPDEDVMITKRKKVKGVVNVPHRDIGPQRPPNYGRPPTYLVHPHPSFIRTPPPTRRVSTGVIDLTQEGDTRLRPIVDLDVIVLD